MQIILSKRKTMTNNKPSEIILYGTKWCPDCIRAKRILKKFNVTYVEINISGNPEAAKIVEQLNNGNRCVPTIIFPDGSHLTEPSTETLTEKIKKSNQ
jgi:mycoredoxin